MTDWRLMQNEPSHMTNTNGYSGSGMLPDDKPCRRNKLQIITLMYGTGGGNYSQTTESEDHGQSFNRHSEKSHYLYDNDHNDENSGRSTDSRHSLDKNCHEQPCCNQQRVCIFAPSTSTWCCSTSDGSFACRTDLYWQTGDQESGPVSYPAEAPIVVSEADSTTGASLKLNPPPAKKQKKAVTKKYRCHHPGCEKSLSSQNSLHNHKSQYHTGERTCLECQKPLRNARALAVHKRKDHTGKQTCPECQKPLPNAQALAVHKSQYHTGERTCLECQKPLRNARALAVHKRKDHTGKQTCPECQKPLPNAQALAVHKSQYHTGERTCLECQKPLRNARALAVHKRKDHTGEQTCAECQKTLPNVQALANHKGKYHTGKQTCPECQKILPNPSALSNHKRQHRRRKLDDAKSSD
ncbi:C2H2-type zinc finger protein [Endozoicomonas sp. 8E]|uniref:C2H2-type zinc finger protein n=1 Tax=Endozoicomonas sp. 8E TaxID=3035692 RepID=UPI002938EA91|nr:C2H2-type zinc finger protein [Endozoicomonas sp. 8E]WOG27832.1 C2H2-type zinc finger protein [Endozoicomonas sp. 8E]